MVSLDIVHASNAQIRQLGPGLVALFVGATSGIGEYTAKAFVKNAISPRVYIVGRNQSAAERIIKECADLNPDGKVEFLKADVTELAEVDRICKEIQRKEKHINLLVQSQGNLTLRGRDESQEGLDRKFTLNYYSRMRFISNLLPLLKTATASVPHFSRTLSILSAGHAEGRVDFKDLELKNTFSGSRCAAHSIVMNDFMTEEFSSRQPGTAFIHSYPHIVSTGLSRELPFWARIPAKIMYLLLSPFAVGAEETGARQLFIATSGLYPPAKPFNNDLSSSGVAPPKSLKILEGADGVEGSGAYLVNWNNDITGKQRLLKEYREKSVGKVFWEHTMAIFEKVEKLNQERAE